MDLKIGLVIDDRYRIDHKLGVGGMAEVYEANDIINKVRVAIKIIKNEMMDNPVNLKRFQNETMIAASLNHPNIVKVLNQGTMDNRPYFVQEFVSGQTIKEVLDYRSHFTLEEACSYMIQLLGALNYAHQHNVIHRDIKPENMFLLPDGTVKLGDFGIASCEDVAATISENSDKIIGSVHYLAPEVCRGNHANVVSDIYACGVTFFEFVTGHVPFSGNSAINVVLSQIKDKFPSPKKYIKDCPKELENIIFKCCAKKPSDRYQNARELCDDIIKFKNDPDSIKKKGFFAKLFGFR